MSSLFGGGDTTTFVQAPAPVAPAPTPLPPPTMPDIGSPANIAAGQMKARQDASRAGRESTILTTPASRPKTIAGGALGGAAQAGTTPSYSSTSL